MVSYTLRRKVEMVTKYFENVVCILVLLLTTLKLRTVSSGSLNRPN